MRGYKGFNSDMTCRGFQYEQGKTYKMDGDIRLCQKGFHFCKNLIDCFPYYDRADSRYCEVDAEGQIEEGDNKCCSSIITIIRELTEIEVNRTKYSNGNGFGYDNGYGYGYSYGNGNGYGYGDGNGYGYGDGIGYGYSNGNGYGDGNGYGYSNGDGGDDDIQRILKYKEI